MPAEIDTSGLCKFVALLYKGLLLRKRHYITTACEIIFPVLIACVPVFIQAQRDVTYDEIYSGDSDWENETIHAPFNPLRSGLETAHRTVFFPFAPSNNNTHFLMSDSIRLWKSHHKDFHVVSEVFNNNEELEAYSMTKLKKNESLIIIGTIFNNIPSTTSLPVGLDFTIRHYSSYMAHFATTLKYRFSTPYDIYSVYASTFFLSWQAAVEKTFIEKKMVEEDKMFDYELWMQEFPSPKYKKIYKGFSVAALIPGMISYGLIIFVANLMQRVIEEKANGCKELLKMMGMTDAIYWTSTFMNYFIVGIIVFLSITIAYKFPLKNSTMLLEHSSFSLVFIIFLLFLASFILFCLALTTFFNKAIYGIIVLIIVYNVCFSLLSSFVFSEKTEITYFPLSTFTKFAICLLPYGSILTISEILLTYEAGGEGIRWSNLYSYDAIPDFSVSWVMFAMLFSCFLYVIIIWYVDAVWPWQYGVPKPVYFPFTECSS